MTYEEFKTKVHDLDFLADFQHGVIDGSVSDSAAFDFFFYAINLCDGWINDYNSDSRSFPDKYFDIILPTRLISAILISIVNRDPACLKASGFKDHLSEILDFCARFGLEYVTLDDLKRSVEAYENADVYGFVNKRPRMSKPFSGFVFANSSKFVSQKGDDDDAC